MELGRHDIESLLPHRDPFLWIDRVIQVEKDRSITAELALSVGHPVFAGHFPGKPIFPGVLQCEAVAQAACLLVLLSRPELQGSDVLLMGFKEVKFRLPVVPPTVLVLSASLLQTRGPVFRMSGATHIGTSLAAELELMATVSRVKAGSP